jgi:ApaG protein
MYSTISAGISIHVETFYQPEYSDPVNQEFMFAYRITIENFNSFTIQLLSRHWDIKDSNGEWREVDGEGVVGVQPMIANGKQFQYVSGCNLKTEIGQMRGYYIVENQNNKEQFKVIIPTFNLIAPHKNN